MDEIIWSVTDSGEFSLKSAIVQNQSMYPAPWLEVMEDFRSTLYAYGWISKRA